MLHGYGLVLCRKGFMLTLQRPLCDLDKQQLKACPKLVTYTTNPATTYQNGKRKAHYYSIILGCLEGDAIIALLSWPRLGEQQKRQLNFSQPIFTIYSNEILHFWENNFFSVNEVNAISIGGGEPAILFNGLGVKRCEPKMLRLQGCCRSGVVRDRNHRLTNGTNYFQNLSQENSANFGEDS